MTIRSKYFEAVWNDPRPETDHKEYRVRLDEDPYSSQLLREAARLLWEKLPDDLPFALSHVAKTMWIDEEIEVLS